MYNFFKYFIFLLSRYDLAKRAYHPLRSPQFSPAAVVRVLVQPVLVELWVAEQFRRH